MIDALISGKLIRQPALKTGKSGTAYCNLLISVSIGEAENIVVSGIAFSDIAERLSKLGQGDAVSLAGSLKPTSWPDKTTGETKHGLTMTVNQSLSVYDIQKRRRKPAEQLAEHVPASLPGQPFDDDLPF